MDSFKTKTVTSEPGEAVTGYLLGRVSIWDQPFPGAFFGSPAVPKPRSLLAETLSYAGSVLVVNRKRRDLSSLAEKIEDLPFFPAFLN